MLVISANLMGTGQAQAKMQQAAEELAKSIAKEESSAAPGSGPVGDKNENADDRAAHKPHMRYLKNITRFLEHDDVSTMLVAHMQCV
jgi:hypothetical protein